MSRRPAYLLAVSLMLTVLMVGRSGEAQSDQGLILSDDLNFANLGFIWNLPAWMPLPPVPKDNPMSVAKVELGRHLFYDTRLSADGTIACVSCHLQEFAFADNKAFSTGVGGTRASHNSPSLANSGYNPSLTWANPHADTLEFQALFPLFGTDPVEMGLAGMEAALFERLSSDAYYATALSKRVSRTGRRFQPLYPYSRSGRIPTQHCIPQQPL